MSGPLPNRRCLLVVERDPAALAEWKGRLEGLDLAVEASSDPADAFYAACELEPALVFCAPGFPEDGVKRLVGMMRQYRGLARTPVIVGNFEEVERALAAPSKPLPEPLPVPVKAADDESVPAKAAAKTAPAPADPPPDEAVAELLRVAARERRSRRASELLLRRRTESAEKKARRMAAVFENELDAAMQKLVAMTERVVEERRKWKETVIALRRKPDGKTVPGEVRRRLEQLEHELAESQSATAQLLRELAKRSRSVQAERKRSERRERVKIGRGAGETFDAAIAAAASEFEARLRACLGLPAAVDVKIRADLNASLGLARLLRLAAAPAPAAPPCQSAKDLRALLAPRLRAWEDELKLRGIMLLRQGNMDAIREAFWEPAGLESALDALFARASGRLGTSGVLSFEVSGRDYDLKLGIKQSTPVRGAPPPEGPELPLIRRLAESWGGSLERSRTPSGRGEGLTLTLRAAVLYIR